MSAPDRRELIERDHAKLSIRLRRLQRGNELRLLLLRAMYGDGARQRRLLLPESLVLAVRRRSGRAAEATIASAGGRAIGHTATWPARPIEPVANGATVEFVINLSASGVSATR
jgi:hypothetical protein